MLWDTTTQRVADKLLDPDYANRWSSRVGPPKAERLCLTPFQPKLGKATQLDGDCEYTKIWNREGRVFRRRICKAYPSGSFITMIKGSESSNAYDLRLVTTLHNDRGQKLSVSKSRETGRLIGECPIGMPIAR